METIELTMGAYVLGAIKGFWGISDVIEGNHFAEVLTAGYAPDSSNYIIKIVWTPLHLEEGTEKYIPLIQLFNETYDSGLSVPTRVNNIVRGFFGVDSATPSSNTSYGEEELLTAFLQSVYVYTHKPLPFIPHHRH